MSCGVTQHKVTHTSTKGDTFESSCRQPATGLPPAQPAAPQLKDQSVLSDLESLPLPLLVCMLLVASVMSGQSSCGCNRYGRSRLTANTPYHSASCTRACAVHTVCPISPPRRLLPLLSLWTPFSGVSPSSPVALPGCCSSSDWCWGGW